MTKTTINHYLQLVTMTEKESGTRIYTSRDGHFEIHVSCCTHDLKYKDDLMNLWEKAGFISQKLPTHICIDTYYTDINNNCYGYYNITHKRSEDGKRTVINFDYLREWTEENIRELVAECVRLCEMDINPCRVPRLGV